MVNSIVEKYAVAKNNINVTLEKKNVHGIWNEKQIYKQYAECDPKINMYNIHSGHQNINVNSI